MSDPEARSGTRLHDIFIGSDLAELIRRQQLTVVLVQPITRWPSEDRPAAFRVELEGGGVLKARQFPRVERARIVERILQTPFRGFPRPIARYEGALLLPWIEGRLLTSLDAIPLDVAHECGRNVGALHRHDVSDWSDVVVRSVAHVRARLRVDTAMLVESGELDEATAAIAGALAEADAPANATAGIIHNDFCPENIVVEPAGTPACIDNATLTFGPHDFDLARIWYRWPMSPDAGAAFLRGYETHRSGASFAQHFAFWAISMLMATAANRLRARIADATRSLPVLRSTVAAIQRGEAVVPWGPGAADGRR
jgi:hypothetical protein